MKNRNYLNLLVVFLLFTVTVSCRKNQKLDSAERIVAEWVGKEIVFPSDIPCIYTKKDTTCPDTHTPYKILVYTDSTGCTSCKLQLYKWDALIKEANAEMKDKISFLFYFQPKNEVELQLLLKREGFKHVIYMDRESKLYAANKFPFQSSYQCFLLDMNNRVLLVGNPVLNPKIWELYKQVIIGEANVSPNKNLDAKTAVEVEHQVMELRDLKVKKTSTVIFTLKNIGDTPLFIRNITASCGCTIPEWRKEPIKAGGKADVKIKVTPDLAGYFRKTINVFCNTKEDAIQLIVKGVVKD